MKTVLEDWKLQKKLEMASWVKFIYFSDHFFLVFGGLRMFFPPIFHRKSAKIQSKAAKVQSNLAPPQ